MPIPLAPSLLPPLLPLPSPNSHFLSSFIHLHSPPPSFHPLTSLFPPPSCLFFPPLCIHLTLSLPLLHCPVLSLLLSLSPSLPLPHNRPVMAFHPVDTGMSTNATLIWEPNQDLKMFVGCFLNFLAECSPQWEEFFKLSNHRSAKRKLSNHR